MSVSYRYDAMNRLTNEDRAGAGERYAYDLCGNRLIREKYQNGSIDATEGYRYNERNELTERIRAGLTEKRESFYNRILYTGQQYDQETGQYYLRARYYNPVVGRFLQEDTYRGDGLNLYAYCANNPVSYFDPSGHATVASNTPCGGETTTKKQSKTPGEISSFGNKESPRGARPEKDFGLSGFDDIVGPESGPFPKGASNFDNVVNASLTGHYHTLPKGTELPDGLGIIADGIDVNPDSPHGKGHYTIFPTKEMTVSEFNELFKSLPWIYGGKKK